MVREICQDRHDIIYYTLKSYSPERMQTVGSTEIQGILVWQTYAMIFVIQIKTKINIHIWNVLNILYTRVLFSTTAVDFWSYWEREHPLRFALLVKNETINSVHSYVAKNRQDQLEMFINWIRLISHLFLESANAAYFRVKVHSYHS